MRNLGLTLAGGGNRSFYQQGLLEEWGELVWPRVATVACSSAGAAMVLLALSGRARQARERWDTLREGLRRNVDPVRLLRKQDLFPHGHIFRTTLLTALDDGGFERIVAQPFPIQVLCSRPPRGWSLSAAVWAGVAAYELEKRMVAGTLHPRSGTLIGFRQHVVDARDCHGPEDLADLVLASSSMPPFVPVGKFRGEPLLDGGLIDNVPAFVADRAPQVRKNLVLLTRVYPVALQHPSRLYVQPSEPIAVKRWDYSEGAPVDQAIDLGRRDARGLRTRLATWLESPSEQQASAQERLTCSSTRTETRSCERKLL